MKNLLIYINPNKKFDQETSLLAKIQIDNSLELGWKKQDIMLITNFNYQYQGIKAIRVNNSNYCSARPLSTKTTTIAYLMENGIIKKKQLYWVHDFDAYQQEPISVSELKLGDKDFGLTDYGWSDRWCLGSIFFKERSKDIFKLLVETMLTYKYKLNDEQAMIFLTKKNSDDITERYKKLNITYNFGMRKIADNFQRADKPLRVLHFHPFKRGKDVLDCFMYGKNELGFPLMNKRLIKIFKKNL